VYLQLPDRGRLHGLIVYLVTHHEMLQVIWPALLAKLETFKLRMMWTYA